MCVFRDLWLNPRTGQVLLDAPSRVVKQGSFAPRPRNSVLDGCEVAVHPFFLPYAGPVIGLVDSPFSHQNCCLTRPRSAGSSASLNHPNLRRDGLVEYDMINIWDMQTLLSNARGYQNVVFAVSEVFENLHLLALA